MDSLLLGKTPSSIECEDSTPDAAFVNARKDKAKVSGRKAQHSIFVNCSFLEGNFEDCNFAYCIFINCYFRGARFSNCVLTGAKFIDCNFRAATFIHTNVDYTLWRTTYIRLQSISACIPVHQPNIAVELLMALRINATSIGEYDDAKAFLSLSEEMSRKHLLKMMFSRREYYKKYDFLEKLSAAPKFIASWLNKVFWGYGERPFQLVIVSSIIVFLFSVYYLLNIEKYIITHKSIYESALYSAKLSILAFTGASLDAYPDALRSSMEIPLIFESIFGLVFISFLAASLHRAIATRKE